MQSEEEPIQVFVLEDDPRIQRYFVRLLNTAENLSCIGAAGSLQEAREMLDLARRADVLLIDLGLPDGHGTELILEVSHWEPAPRIAVISSLGDERTVIAAIEAGATGYLLKDADHFEFQTMVQALYAGEAPISPAIARHLLKRFQAPTTTSADTNAEVQLTTREAEVLELAAKGHSFGEISKSLGLASSTVNTHVKHIYRKLGVSSRSAAVYEATQAGLLKLVT